MFTLSRKLTNPLSILLPLSLLLSLSLLGTAATAQVASYIPSKVGDIANLSRGLNFGGKTRLPVVCNRGYLGGLVGTTLSNGTETSATYFYTYTVMADCTDLQFAFANIQGVGVNGLVTDNASAITVSATICYPFTQYQRLSFPNGTKTVSIDPGGRVMSLPLGTQFTAGQVIQVRVYVTCPASGHWPLPCPLFTGDANNSSTVSGNGSDQTATGSATNTTGSLVAASTGNGFGPVAIFGQQYTPKACVGVNGDSIANGTTDSNLTPNAGYLMRALFGAVGVFRSSIPSAQGQGVDMFDAVATAYEGGLDYIYDEFGINDIHLGSIGLATLKTNAMLRWKHDANRGARVIACTLLPQTKSFDAWATAVGNGSTTGQWYSENSSYSQTATVGRDA